ncbi:MAG: hypothetical protein AAGF58_04170 [Pseudomonadota bacterium]
MKGDLALSQQERIRKWGHRKYVGGNSPATWYDIGKRQYHFLVSQGLQHHHKFLDVACGSLRLGQFLIPMLDEGNYFGLEPEQELVLKGIEFECLFDVIEVKKPKFEYNYSFDVNFCEYYDFAMAQSLFTHLNIEDIDRCFSSLSHLAAQGSRFFFTFSEGKADGNPREASHAQKKWRYEFHTIEKLANNSGFSCEYIGDWGHERGQVIAVATKPA